jgi:putative membrane protein
MRSGSTLAEEIQLDATNGPRATHRFREGAPGSLRGADQHDESFLFPRKAPDRIHKIQLTGGMKDALATGVEHFVWLTGLRVFDTSRGIMSRNRRNTRAIKAEWAMMWGYGGNMGWSWLFGLLLVIGIVLLVVVAVRAFSRGGNRGGGPGTTGPVPRPSRARQILDQRYAKRELTAEQYREQVQVLGENP